MSPDQVDGSPWGHFARGAPSHAQQLSIGSGSRSVLGLGDFLESQRVSVADHSQQPRGPMTRYRFAAQCLPFLANTLVWGCASQEQPLRFYPVVPTAQQQPPPPPPPAPAPTRYYSVELQVEQGALSEALGNRVEQLAADAGERLRPGVKIGLFPPDSCVTTAVSPGGTTAENRIVMECGVLMSGLETRLARAGYQVVSWQTLKPRGGPVGGSAVDRAREFNIDILFEIDQLSRGSRETGAFQYSGMSFNQQTTEFDRVPVQVGAEVAERCKAFVGQGSGPRTEKYATLAVKAVHARSGQALWYYTKSVTESLAATEGKSATHYFSAAPHAELITPPWSPAPPPPPVPVRYLDPGETDARGTQTVGGILVGLGALTPVIGSFATVAGVGIGGGPASLVGAGLGVFGGTVIYWGSGEAAVEAPAPPPPPPPPAPPAPYYGESTFVSAEQVVCNATPATPPWVAASAASASAAVPTSKSSYSFKNTQAGESATEDRLYEMAADDFVSELKAVARGHTP